MSDDIKARQPAKVTGAQLRRAFVKTVQFPSGRPGPEAISPIGGPVDDYTIKTSVDLNRLAHNLNQILEADQK